MNLLSALDIRPHMSLKDSFYHLSISNSTFTQKYIESVDSMLEGYTNTSHNQICGLNTELDPYVPCRFPLAELGPCQNISKAISNEAPCFYIKTNRVSHPIYLSLDDVRMFHANLVRMLGHIA